MKAIILAGGNGSRLEPLTSVTSKQLLPIGNKPMIYYPLSTALLGGVKEILIISQQKNIANFKNILGDGSNLGVSISYEVQEEPKGLAHGLYLSKSFVGSDDFLFILGDNIVHGHGLVEMLSNVSKSKETSMFSYYVSDPKRFGVISSDKDGYINKFIEKPENPETNWASIGLYYFKSDIFKYYDKLEPSHRGEFELPDLVSLYMLDNKVKDIKLGRGFAWFDAGTMSSFQLANTYINSVEISTTKKIACLEEIAFHKGYITSDELKENIKDKKSEYFEYIKEVIDNEI